MPSVRFAQSEASTREALDARVIGSVQIRMATITSPIAFAQNASTRLPAAITRPATVGPRTRDRLNWAELRAIALPIADRSTIVDTTAWKAGVASAPTAPDRNA